MDRFLMQVMITYPDAASEVKVVRLVRGEELPDHAASGDQLQEETAIPQEAIFTAREEIHEIHVSESIEQYIVDLINATRYPERYSEELRKWIQVGASPRGGIGLDKCSRVYAWLNNRDHVTPDDIRAIAHDVLRHRIMLSYEANAEGIKPDQVISELVGLVAVA